ncbi:MAG: alanine racemase [Candidatus Tectomicrobia bacterium]|uniref:Alanine racemase n=1 Tax=Tectimicrobiota bacterium TaxID=2528274 RepID=A0A932FX19_UNCTE|nr:alanine racemase [Candidatus Tectomicrobia bacterium]
MIPLRPTRAEIDLAAFLHNLQQVKGLLPKGVEILAVIKADAYGHGACELARVALEEGVRMLGVATLEEALQLRQEGIVAPILILCGITREQAEAALAYDLSVVLYSWKVAEALDKAAQHRGTPARVHVKVDTGMGRLGLLPEEVGPFVEGVKGLRHLTIEGMMTHFAAGSDEGEQKAQDWGPQVAHAPDPVKRGLKRFQEVLLELPTYGIGTPLIHAANSAAILDFPEVSFEMVRPGILLYGCTPSPEKVPRLSLRPVLTLKTQILGIRRLPPASSIGYGQTYFTSRESRIAILPLGYADGYNRALSNQAQVLVKGKRVPVVGRISMDLCTVDVTDLPEVREGEEVILLGRQGEEEITAWELASIQGTIPYEIFTAVGKRVPRVYRRAGDTNVRSL